MTFSLGLAAILIAVLAIVVSAYGALCTYVTIWYSKQTLLWYTNPPEAEAREDRKPWQVRLWDRRNERRHVRDSR